ncbi:MAG: TolC family protein [Deltaproteobacteria bacterium]|nr:MAG: TolC family protein [Deltaproteobacteria bacterium]
MIRSLLLAALALAAAPALADDALPLTPDDAVRHALAAAPSLDAQQAATRQAQRDAATATVDFAPILEGTASYTRLSKVELPPLNFGGMEIDNPFVPVYDNYSLKGTLTWPVSDLFFAILPGYRASLGALEVQRASEEVERRKVARDALQAYYQLVLVREGLAVAETGVALLEAHEVQLADLFEAGLVTRADVLQVQAQLAEARAQRETLLGQSTVAEAHLCTMLQIPAPVAVLLPEPPTDEESRSAEELVALAESQRPEVRLLDQLVQTHRHAARAQRGAALPHIAVVGNYTYANPNQRISPPTAEFNGTWDATVAMTWSPGESLKRANDAAKAKTEQLKAEADLETLERGLNVQVAAALADLRAATRLTVVAAEQVSAAEAAFEAQTDLLEAGSATATEALQAEASARRARLALVDARVDLTLAQIDLDYAIGDALAPENAP